MNTTKKVGNIGENIAAKLLKAKGYAILCRNYRKKWGEIDIVTRKNNVIHFIEVKTISRENIPHVSSETFSEYRPEENMHQKKIERLHRAIESHIAEKSISDDWQLDLITVTLYTKTKRAECKVIENVL